MNFVAPRKVTKSVYNAYTDTDYNSFATNLNPLNPTELETQYNFMVNEVRGKLKEIYIQNNISIEDKDVFTVDIPSIEAVQDALDDIMNQMKLSENPLYDMVQEGLPIGPALTTPMDWITNPFQLDCNGIEVADFAGTGDIGNLTEVGEDANTDGTNNGNTGNLEPGEENPDIASDTATDYVTYTVTYNNTDRLQPDDWGPTVFTKALSTLEFKNGVVKDDAYTFVGWYLDGSFSEKISHNKLLNPRKNIQLYANVVRSEEYNESGVGTVTVAKNQPIVGVGDNNCDIREMAWLKIILMILKVCKIIIKVLVLVYNIARAASEIAKDAQLCWINPPSLMSLINYVMQRVGSILFQVLGKLLLYLWSLLNLDCLSARSTELINEINAVLAGVQSSIAGFDAAAVLLSGGSLQEEWAKAMKELKNKVTDAKKEFKEQWSNIGSQLLGDFDESGLGQLKDAFITNPWGFLADNVIPDKIKNQIMDMYDAMQTSKEVINVLNNQVKAKQKNKQVKQGEDKKGVEVAQVN